ncbi:MAG: DMT family transporter, partial [Halothiobacillus sp.]
MSNNVKTSFVKPFSALVLLALLWGYNWVVMKGGLNDIAALWFGAIRTLAPALLLLLLLPLLGRPIKPPPLSYVIPLGLLQTAGFVGFMMWALRTGAAGETAVIVFTMPLWLTLMAHVVLHERLSRLQWLALGIAGFGLFMMVAPWRGHLAIASSIFALLSGITWAGG